jgi:hypothetical protein
VIVLLQITAGRPHKTIDKFLRAATREVVDCVPLRRRDDSDRVEAALPAPAGPTPTFIERSPHA